ncbi:nucleotidyl transferase AbiEii/AbiGii toxin family protein [soil metagenome]
MNRPTRETAAGRAYLELQARARRERRPTDELLVLYVLERFLFRLSRSEHRHRLVLKGGMLLAAFDQRRPTRDVDLLATAGANDLDTVAAVVRDIVAVEVELDDGVVFEPDRLTARTIRDQDVYAAARIVVPARVHRAQHPLRVDVNVGDPVTPAPVEVDYPALVAEPFPLVGYPIETVLAEKLVTMVDRGDATTRERDFADVLLLIRRHDLGAAGLSTAITATASHRQTELRPLGDILVTLGARRQASWERFAARSGLGDVVPHGYQETIARVIEFADPILTGGVTGGVWRPGDRVWRW